MPRALITGVTGQDGSYLAELLLGRGYEVHGIVRRSSSFHTERIDHLYTDPHLLGDDGHGEPGGLRLHYGDMLDGTALRRILDAAQPDEVYTLAAQSHVRVSFDQSEHTADVAGLGALRLFEAVRDHARAAGRPVRVYQAGSSEMFGLAPAPQNEASPFLPRSPYAVAKVAAHHFGVTFREAYGLFIANGILFNHESPRRGETFVTRKIPRAAARIRLGLQDRLYLGELDARRDWGFAGDYVVAMWLMLQQPVPGDFVVATGESHSVREFLEAAFGRLELDWQAHVVLDPRYRRPVEIPHLRGDSTRARATLGWTPRVRFAELVAMMVDHDLDLAQRERAGGAPPNVGPGSRAPGPGRA